MSLRVRTRECILDSIESGEWAAGSKLPPERELAEKLNVSRTTLRLVLLELTAHGLISPLQGSGYYVAPTDVDVRLALGRGEAVSVDEAGCRWTIHEERVCRRQPRGWRRA